MRVHATFNTAGRQAHSGTVAQVEQYQVRAESDAGAIMTFGLRAPDDPHAMVTALERLPWTPKAIRVDPVRCPGERAL